MVNATVEACSAEVLEGLAAFRACYVRDTASRDLHAKAHIPANVVPHLTLSARVAIRAKMVSGHCC
jgi:hypothetical protein